MPADQSPPLHSADELKSFLALIPTLNFYQRLKVSSAATREEIQRAFHREALHFHPDRYQGQLKKDLVEDARKIYVKIVEAYRVLSNREQRANYDSHLADGGVASSASETNSFTSSMVKKPTLTGPGARFYKLAVAALQSGNHASAKMNIQLALNMEPTNADYKKLLEKIASKK